ncbi:hypothetical protein GUITHDRAFT_112161 [Guillardia theta CCMP2712]|uniref:Uncharacterized protein n=1 Tax=Guillardia theta (strain CCMP2712) TaxID=905079 RepID=L1IZS2_GUITC|nr:hypothetical protein GUITHDRAFT_112161 [Guillardia theta CCMP2712]EKX41746.1 hypothetical protein GUITHDRAFT_112161 [Guillardia theta CCMP2712]|eukprot:XP_005828726.1 hypothetical protein GUITHDRAFT_112161 [Guillardia theta CCMP2712]
MYSLEELYEELPEVLQDEAWWKEWKEQWSRTQGRGSKLEGSTSFKSPSETLTSQAAAVAQGRVDPPHERQDVQQEEVAAKYRAELLEASVRMDLLHRNLLQEEMQFNAQAIQAARTADARLKSAGMTTRFYRQLKKPAWDHQVLRSGQGIRQNVSRRTGRILEALRLQTLKDGEIRMNSQSIDDEWAEQIGRALVEEKSSYSFIDLSSNFISSQGFRWVSLGLSQQTRLSDLRLSGNPLDGDAMDLIADCMTINTSITSLDLSCLKFGEKRAGSSLPGDGAPGEEEQRTAAGLKLGMSRFLHSLLLSISLTRLDLGGNGMGSTQFRQLCDWNDLGVDGGGYLGRLLAASSRIQHVDASSNWLGTEGATNFFLQLNTNTGLTSLNLSSNKMFLSEDVSPPMNKIFLYFPRLVDLNVSANDAFAGSNLLDQDSFKSSHLGGIKLMLNKNPIGIDGCKRLVRAAGSWFPIVHLELRGCDLEDSYLIVLGAMLLSASSLRRLHLADNRITERGVSFILRWLQVPESKSRLEVLDMDGNRCQDPVAGCQHIPSLRSIFLRSNLVSDMATQQVHDMLKTRGFGQISILL